MINRSTTAFGIRQFLVFVIIAATIWWLLPDRELGPWGAWNLKDLWAVVVVVRAIGFAAWAAGRWLGPGRGTLVTAAIGAAYSSTAVTAALARLMRADPATRPAATAGIAVASAVMFLRVTVLTALAVPFALPALVRILLPSAVLALILAVWLARRRATVADGLALPAGNPVALPAALGFAGLVALGSLAAHWAQARYGGEGVALSLALAGALDVDAAVVAMRALGPDAVPEALGGAVLALPILLNTLFKALVVLAASGPRVGGAAVLVLLAAAALLAVGLVLAGAPALLAG